MTISTKEYALHVDAEQNQHVEFVTYFPTAILATQAYLAMLEDRQVYHTTGSGGGIRVD